ncbi:MAG: hypothetical protein PHS37_10245, partial [Candidatus Omnitrophica bacterium]|nr:hypothetical protein [Candidatus Omnitrophota bacterium]
MRVLLIALVCGVVGAVVIWAAPAPEPAFQVTAKVVNGGGGKTMDIEILEVGKCARPGLYGSFTKYKFKAGDILTVVIMDAGFKAKANSAVDGILERVADAKG